MEHRLRLHQQAGSYEVWLDTQYDGLCIGIGMTAHEALESARNELLSAVAKLERMKMEHGNE